jgi:hypothetical protein
MLQHSIFGPAGSATRCPMLRGHGAKIVARVNYLTLATLR